jgi:hypothetical protein
MFKFTKFLVIFGVTGDFFVAPDNSKCPGSNQPLKKNEYQDTPGGKDGRCVWLTTYHLQVPMSRTLEAWNSPQPSGPHRPVMGVFYVLPCDFRGFVNDNIKVCAFFGLICTNYVTIHGVKNVIFFTPSVNISSVGVSAVKVPKEMQISRHSDISNSRTYVPFVAVFWIS